MQNQWDILPNKQVLAVTMEAMQKRGFDVIQAKTAAEALAAVKNLLPPQAEVMTGSSTTLKQIGFMEYLESSSSNLKNLHAEITAEPDEQKRADKRRHAVSADYFLASVNAVSQNGELVACDATGSRVTAFPYAAKHLVLVVSTQKITPSLEAAMQRVREYVFPLEDKRSMDAYGAHSAFGKWVIVEKEAKPHRITVILVEEKLGF